MHVVVLKNPMKGVRRTLPCRFMWPKTRAPASEGRQCQASPSMLKLLSVRMINQLSISFGIRQILSEQITA